jgi:hypothetical protein
MTTSNRQMAIAFCNKFAPQWGPYPDPNAPPFDRQRYAKLRKKLARYRWDLSEMFHIFVLWPPGFETEQTPVDARMYRTLDEVERFAATLDKTS